MYGVVCHAFQGKIRETSPDPKSCAEISPVAGHGQFRRVVLKRIQASAEFHPDR